MNEFSDIQRLIRLKRHERPPGNFVDQFVARFQDRQRAELLRHSARGLLWERVTTYMEGLLNPKWAWAGATAVAVLGLGFMLRPTATATGQVAQNGKSALSLEAREVQEAAYQLLHKDGASGNSNMRQYLISQHYGGGLGDEQLESNAASKVYPAGFNVDLREFSQR